MPVSTDALLASAQQLPEVESARLGIDIARRDLRIARSSYYPTLSLSAGYGSSYSDARQKMFMNPDGTYRYEAYPLAEQYKDNASSYISVSLNVPIFGRLTTRHNVQRQKIAVRQAEYALRTTEKQVNKEATQALIDSRTAWDKYLSSQKYVASAEEAAGKWSKGTISERLPSSITTRRSMRWSKPRFNSCKPNMNISSKPK